MCYLIIFFVWEWLDQSRSCQCPWNCIIDRCIEIRGNTTDGGMFSLDPCHHITPNNFAKSYFTPNEMYTPNWFKAVILLCPVLGTAVLTALTEIWSWGDIWKATRFDLNVVLLLSFRFHFFFVFIEDVLVYIVKISVF